MTAEHRGSRKWNVTLEGGSAESEGAKVSREPTGTIPLLPDGAHFLVLPVGPPRTWAW